jgi:hypothetical protein
MKAKEFIEEIKQVTLKATRYVATLPANDKELPQLNAILRGIKMTAIGREVYLEMRKSEPKPAAKVEIPEAKEILKATKETLVGIASQLGIDLNETMQKNEIVKLIEEKRA